MILAASPLQPRLSYHSLALSCEGFALLRALLHQSEAHPLSFLPLPHSLRVYPGWHHQPYSQFASITLMLSLTLVESALTDDLRVSPCFGRTSLLATPLESALTESQVVSPLESALAKKWGRGGSNHPNSQSYSLNFLLGVACLSRCSSSISALLCWLPRSHFAKNSPRVQITYV